MQSQLIIYTFQKFEINLVAAFFCKLKDLKMLKFKNKCKNIEIYYLNQIQDTEATFLYEIQICVFV